MEKEAGYDPSMGARFSKRKVGMTVGTSLLSAAGVVFSKVPPDSLPSAISISLVGLCILGATTSFLWAFSGHPLHDWRKTMGPLLVMALGLVVYIGGAVWFYFSDVPSQNLLSGAGTEGSPIADSPILAPNNTGIITNNQSGGQNTVNNYGPLQRRISTETADLIVAQLRAAGPHTVAIVDFSGGTNPEVSAYTLRLTEIIKAAGWTIESGAPKTYLPLGTPPAKGIHFLFRGDVAPAGAIEMRTILVNNGVEIENTYTKFPALVNDDAVIGIAVGYGAQ